MKPRNRMSPDIAVSGTLVGATLATVTGVPMTSLAARSNSGATGIGSANGLSALARAKVARKITLRKEFTEERGRNGTINIL
jgi:hypothetical protein